MWCKPNVFLTACLVLAGCTLSGTQNPDRPRSASPTPAHEVPIAIVTHLAADVENVTVEQARELIDKGADN